MERSVGRPDFSVLKGGQFREHTIMTAIARIAMHSARISAVGLMVCFLLLVAPLPGQDRRIAPPGGSARRLALVMGNDAYPDKRLVNAVNDARVMQTALTAAGFTVKLQINSTLQQMEEAIDRFVG